MLLCADIGGTKTRLALSSSTVPPHTALQAIAVFSNRDFATFDALLDHYLAQHPGANTHIAAAAFAIAGPVHGDRCAMTNLHWLIDAAAIAARHRIPRVQLCNDLAATALGIPILSPEDFFVVQDGDGFDPRATPKAVLAVGTGLGEALLLQHPANHYIAVPSEGGHKDFAPHNQQARALYEKILARENVDYLPTEAIISGSGLPRLLQALTAVAAPDPPHIIDDAIQHPDSPSRLAVTALLDALAAEAANIALQYVSVGGVVIAGGIPPRLTAVIDRERFARCFAEKAHYHTWLQRFPIAICTNADAPLLGALASLATA